MRIKRSSLIRSAVACWFSRLASVGLVSRSRAGAAAAAPAIDSSRPEAGWRLTGWMLRPTSQARAQSGVRDRSSPGISFHACTLHRFLVPPSIHVTSAAAARIRLSSATVGVRGERSVTTPAARTGDRSRDGVRLCSVGLPSVYRPAGQAPSRSCRRIVGR